MPSAEYKALLDQAWDLHVAKNAGYAGAENPDAFANFRMCEQFGVSAFEGCMVRISDKYSRITSLMRDANNERVGESIRDTLRDLSAYALIAVCLLDEQTALRAQGSDSPAAPEPEGEVTRVTVSQPEYADLPVFFQGWSGLDPRVIEGIEDLLAGDPEPESRITREEWGVGDGPIVTFAGISLRGELPVETYVLPTCMECGYGLGEHDLKCSLWR